LKKFEKIIHKITLYKVSLIKISFKFLMFKIQFKVQEISKQISIFNLQSIELFSVSPSRYINNANLIINYSINFNILNTYKSIFDWYNFCLINYTGKILLQKEDNYIQASILNDKLHGKRLVFFPTKTIKTIEDYFFGKVKEKIYHFSSNNKLSKFCYNCKHIKLNDKGEILEIFDISTGKMILIYENTKCCRFVGYNKISFIKKLFFLNFKFKY
jgi:hypothetical protein